MEEPLLREEQDRFFREATKFLEKRYGFDTSLRCHVIWTKRHRTSYTLCDPKASTDKKERLNALQRVLFHETGLSDLSQAFERINMEQVFGYDVGVYDKTEGKKASNKSIKELKNGSSPQGSGNRKN